MLPHPVAFSAGPQTGPLANRKCLTRETPRIACSTLKCDGSRRGPGLLPCPTAVTWPEKIIPAI